MWEQLARTSAGTLIAYKLATGGLKRGSLQRDGAAAAFVVGLLSFSCSIRCGVTLLFFYKSGSMLTRVGADVKRKVEEGYAAEGQRGAAQVLACSAVGVAAAVLRRALVGPDAPLDFSDLASAGNRLTLAYVSFFACCAGDTWASELGVLSASPPRIITQPWRTAPAGTNGGVSVLGTLASAAGGACTGACRRGIRVAAHTGVVARTRARHVLVCNPTFSRAQRLYRRQGHSHQPLRSLRQASEPATPPACSRPRAARCSARVGLASSSLAQLRTCRVCVDRRSAWSGPGWWAAWAALCSTRCWARPCRQPTTTRRAAWWSGGPHPRRDVWRGCRSSPTRWSTLSRPPPPPSPPPPRRGCCSAGSRRRSRRPEAAVRVRGAAHSRSRALGGRQARREERREDSYISHTLGFCVH